MSGAIGVVARVSLRSPIRTVARPSSNEIRNRSPSRIELVSHSIGTSALFTALR
jgi:hypothetical protein